MPRHRTAVVLAGLATCAAAAASADAAGPVVVELFTSQSCYSCPPAEAFLGELASRPGIVALEWHVDYWNDITYGSAGQWVDPFSSREATERQVRYNQAIRGTGAVYTPQMVIDGRTELVGSRRDEVEAALSEASAAAPGGPSVAIAAAGTRMEVTVEGSASAPAEVWLVRYLTKRLTEVPRGENHGKDLANHHVVIAVERLGAWSGPAQQFSAAPPAPGEGCAVLVQASPAAPIAAAALCPPLES